MDVQAWLVAAPWWLAPLLALGLGMMALAPLGEQVLRRGVVFIDLAVAQAAAAVALWWIWWQDHPPAWSTRVAALVGALVAVVWVRHLARRHPAHREALIGLVYVLGAGLAVLGASQEAHGREHLSELLAADILWADWPEVAQMALLVVLGRIWQRIAAARSWRADRGDWFFYLWFAVAASLSMGVLGLWLVFAGLIVPAWLGIKGWGQARRGTAVLLACGVGLWVSSLFDWPSGACVIVALAGLGLTASRLIAPDAPDRLGSRPEHRERLR
jgi:zinc/manganese transport system permease protein